MRGKSLPPASTLISSDLAKDFSYLLSRLSFFLHRANSWMCNECMQIKYILMQKLIFQIIFYNFFYIKTHMKGAGG